MIILFAPMVGSIKEGIEQEDWIIPAREMGLFLVSADTQVYEKAQDLEFEIPKNISTLKKIPHYLDFLLYISENLFVSIWMIFFNFMLFYKGSLWILGDVSKRRRAMIVSLCVMVFVQILVLGVPFKGMFSLGKFIIGVFSGV